MPELVHKLRKVRNLGDVISATIETVRQHLKPLFVAITRHAGPYAISGAVLLAIAQTFTMADSFTDILLQRRTMDTVDPTYLMIQIIGLCLTSYGSIILMNVVVSYLQFVNENDRSPEPEELVMTMSSRTSKILLTTFIVVFLIGAAAGLAVLLTVLALRTTVLLYAAFPMVLAALVYVMVPLIVLYPVVLFEDLGFFDALARARQLVKGMWWWTLGAVIAISLITATLNVVGSIPFYTTSGLSIFLTSGEESGDPNIILQILTIAFGSFANLVNVYVGTITITGLTYIYWSHRERLEGHNLLERIDAIEIDGPHEEQPEA